MCMEDIKLGRALQSQAKFVTVAAGSPVPICGTSIRRTRLIVSSDGVGLVYVCPGTLTLVASQGIALVTANPLQIFRIEDYGQLICQPWFAFISAGTAVITVIESSLEREK